MSHYKPNVTSSTVLFCLIKTQRYSTLYKREKQQIITMEKQKHLIFLLETGSYIQALAKRVYTMLIQPFSTRYISVFLSRHEFLKFGVCGNFPAAMVHRQQCGLRRPAKISLSELMGKQPQRQSRLQ